MNVRCTPYVDQALTATFADLEAVANHLQRSVKPFLKKKNYTYLGRCELVFDITRCFSADYENKQPRFKR